MIPNVREVSVKEPAGMTLGVLVRVHMRKRSLQVRHEQERDGDEGGDSEIHLFMIIVRSWPVAVRNA
jgi:hypothetical protein